MSYTLRIMKKLKKAEKEKDWDKYKQLQEEFRRVYRGSKAKNDNKRKN